MGAKIPSASPSSLHSTDGGDPDVTGISGLVVEYIVAIDVTRVRFPADALFRLEGVEAQPNCPHVPSGTGFPDFDRVAIFRSFFARAIAVLLDGVDGTSHCQFGARLPGPMLILRPTPRSLLGTRKPISREHATDIEIQWYRPRADVSRDRWIQSPEC